MKLADTINKADSILSEAARLHAGEKQEECVEQLICLRELLNAGIEVDTPGDDDTSENCSLCGKPKIT